MVIEVVIINFLFSPLRTLHLVVVLVCCVTLIISWYYVKFWQTGVTIGKSYKAENYFPPVTSLIGE